MSPADDIDAMQLTPDPDKLLAYHRQQLSAMLDGELSPDQAKFMLRRLQHDGELAACWDRWQVCGDMLRGQHHALLPSDFAARVARGIAEPVAVEMAASPAMAAASGRRLRWGGGAALAASVALAAVFAPRLFTDDADIAPYPGQSPVLASAGLAGGGDSAVAVTGSDEVPASPAPAAAGAPDVLELAPAALATALAAAEAPRRSAERRARTTPQVAATRQAPAAAVADGPSIAPPAPVLALADPHSAFPAPTPLQPRPWPRAVLPGASDSAFSVGYGQLSGSLQGDDAGYDPRFLPRGAMPLVSLPDAAADGGRERPDAAPVTP
ncbi:hypothetical protein E2F46_05365 [Luteimonas aestuarii]|uniref:Anti sigma-E protein RseA N-terminal domain-containing protein n=1 Tax=Luteimonas aestuarii TaxID=453837 RepID=A0A4R5TY05_9GAMM|nr:sigma-E factor negative regulatory protein [Luteimonas aestuarii]TDK26031.1 hypothetical protein E2F46_05365 [Luteimonas aestuarii]